MQPPGGGRQTAEEPLDTGRSRASSTWTYAPRISEVHDDVPRALAELRARLSETLSVAEARLSQGISGVAILGAQLRALQDENERLREQLGAMAGGASEQCWKMTPSTCSTSAVGIRSMAVTRTRSMSPRSRALRHIRHQAPPAAPPCADEAAAVALRAGPPVGGDAVFVPLPGEVASDAVPPTTLPDVFGCPPPPDAQPPPMPPAAGDLAPPVRPSGAPGRGATSMRSREGDVGPVGRSSALSARGFGSGPTEDQEDAADYAPAIAGRVAAMRRARNSMKDEEDGLGGFFGGRASRAGDDEENWASKKRGVFMDVQAIKSNMKHLLMKPEYSVTQFYKTEGWAQFVARHIWFENATLAVIALNTVWIGIDTHFNQADVLLDAGPLFIIAECLFCLYFLLEWIFRYSAFENKRDGLRDRWFVFDSGLCTIMVLETWFLPVVFFVLGNTNGGSALKNVAVLKAIKILRLLRMARMAKLLRAVPEIMVIVRAMATATRTVTLTLGLLVIVVYVFGIVFTQVTKGTKLQEQYFSTLFHSMHSLLIAGAFPDQNDIMRAVVEEHFIFWLVLMFFLMLGTVTIMNMMIGVLVEVVNGTSGAEKEMMEVQFLRDNLLRIVANKDQRRTRRAPVVDPCAVMLTKLDFASLLEGEETLRVLDSAGVDIMGLVDLMDMIFKDNRPLSFLDLLEEILQLRNSNTATVKDLVTLRKFVTHEMWFIKRCLRRLVGDARDLHTSSNTAEQDMITSSTKISLYKGRHNGTGPGGGRRGEEQSPAVDETDQQSRGFFSESPDRKSVV